MNVADAIRMRQARIGRHVEALLPFIGNDSSQMDPHIDQLKKELNGVLEEMFTADCG
jgi:hypothetical protein